MFRNKEAMTGEAEKQKLNDKILQLSLKYKFVTPLTSMVVTMPDELKATPRLVDDDVVATESLPHVSLSSISSAGMSGSSRRVAYFMPPHASGMGGRVFSQMPPQRPSFDLMSLPSFQPMKRNFITPLKTNIKRKILRRPPVKKTTTTTTTTTTTQKPSKSVQQPRRSKKSKFASFLIEIQGLTSPLCMNLDMKPGNFTFMKTLIGDEEILVQAGLTRRRVTPIMRVILTKQTLRQDLSADPTLGDGAQIFAISSNNIKMNVTQSIEGSSGRLQLYTHIPVTAPDDLDGVIGFFKGMRGKIIKQLKKKRKLIAKLKLKKGSKKFKVRAVELKFPAPNMDSCWFLNKGSMKRLKLDLLQFQS
uniref:Uncharacterized protein n=1 Tax=Pinctada fucata TaxID=50426 RepID=A0A194AMG2_PINFU